MIKIRKKERKPTEINASSMADIAFLLLIFFLVTTTIASDKGITRILPPDIITNPTKIKDRNLLSIQLNSENGLMIEEGKHDFDEIKEITRTFLSNHGIDPHLSENPQEAVVSIKVARGTSYAAYIKVMDAVKLAYFELRAESVGIPLRQYVEILNTQLQDRTRKEQRYYENARITYPIRIAEIDPE